MIMPKKEPTTFVAVRLPKQLKAELERWAKEEDRTLSNLILRILRKAMADAGK